MSKDKQNPSRLRQTENGAMPVEVKAIIPPDVQHDINPAGDHFYALKYAKHQKVVLRKHPVFNEKWLHDRISDDPLILGLGEVRVLDRERVIQGGGRLDLLLLDEDNDRRYEVEVQFGPTDPSHIIRCIEYWDEERRRYPAYEHVAVLVAENITARFLNVVALLAGSIPIIAIQLDALSFQNHLLLHFTQVLDQTELRVDDTEEEIGGNQVDRGYWDKKAGTMLMKTCDEMLQMINSQSSAPQEMNYLRGYMGLRSNGVVNNFMTMAPKPTKNSINMWVRNTNAAQWKEKFEREGVPVKLGRKDRLRVSLTPTEFDENKMLIQDLITGTVKESGA